MVFSIFLKLYNHHHYLKPSPLPNPHNSHPWLSCLPQTPHCVPPSMPPIPRQPFGCLVSMDLPIPDAAAAAAKLLQSCPTLCNPIDCSPPGSAIPGILQARTLEWVAMSFSNAWQWKVKVKLLICVWLCNPMDCSPPGSSIHGIFQARVLEWGAIAFSTYSR